MRSFEDATPVKKAKKVEVHTKAEKVEVPTKAVEKTEAPAPTNDRYFTRTLWNIRQTILAAVTVPLETHSQTRRVTRIIVYAYHPKYLYRNPSTEVGTDYDLALGLTTVLGNVKEFRYGHFERRAEWLAKSGIRGRLPRHSTDVGKQQVLGSVGRRRH